MKIELLDGAMGTTISNIYKNQEKCKEKVNLTNPEIILEIHKKYSEVGADYLKANTFNCSRKALENYGENPKEAYKYAVLGGKLCKEISKKYKKKSIGTLCIGDIDQIDGIIDSGVDIIMIETIYDMQKGLETLGLLRRRLCLKKINKPIMLSFAVNGEGNIYSGENILNIYKKFLSTDVMSLGINCSEFSQDIFKILKKLKRDTNLKISFHPNSDGDVQKFLGNITKLINENIVDIVGGCCGTDFNHIKRLKGVIESLENKNGVPDES
ncbi:homocysteine S-methyltransferase family protein [Cetobacterium somerae]|uniref:homocysteine S-methyltransferase family protein n=1 Tax=Cetobacterium sp. NK01 TaxID=2993530 RepID=UPI00211636AC|nr:homocysteine S-methyltransferase family protein [Cetobacterium sp. NK01]MCQ8212960.1 homocysteine S-methyltransferase family protein [Cetobacterium sp. NK01]